MTLSDTGPFVALLNADNKSHNIPLDLADVSLIATADVRQFARLSTAHRHYYMYLLSSESDLELVN